MTICLFFLPYCLETTTLSEVRPCLEPICDWLGNRRMIDCIMILFSKFTRFLFCHDLLLQMMLVWLMLTFVQLRLRGLIRASLPLCGHYSELQEIKPLKSDILHCSAMCHTNYLYIFFSSLFNISVLRFFIYCSGQRHNQHAGLCGRLTVSPFITIIGSEVFTTFTKMEQL